MNEAYRLAQQSAVSRSLRILRIAKGWDADDAQGPTYRLTLLLDGREWRAGAGGAVCRFKDARRGWFARGQVTRPLDAPRATDALMLEMIAPLRDLRQATIRLAQEEFYARVRRAESAGVFETWPFRLPDEWLRVAVWPNKALYVPDVLMTPDPTTDIPEGTTGAGRVAATREFEDVSDAVCGALEGGIDLRAVDYLDGHWRVAILPEDLRRLALRALAAQGAARGSADRDLAGGDLRAPRAREDATS